MINKIYYLFSSTILLFLTSCHDTIQKNETEIVTSVYEEQVRSLEKMIPNSLYDTNHIAIWRSGSIFYSEYVSALIINKKQLEDTLLNCHYISFDYYKSSNYKYCNEIKLYNITLKNKPIIFPLDYKIKYDELDTLTTSFGEGIKANNYWIAEFESKIIYPINKRYNSKYTKVIASLFNQINKKERVQTLTLTEDSVNYRDAFEIINESDQYFILKDDLNFKSKKGK